MTLRWFRASGGSVASALLVSIAVLALPHPGESHHDPDTDFAIVAAHDESAHSVGSPSSDEAAPQHCAICHWSRSFRPLTEVAFLASSSLESACPARPDVFRTAVGDHGTQPPLRGPPISPTCA